LAYLQAARSPGAIITSPSSSSVLSLNQSLITGNPYAIKHLTKQQLIELFKQQHQKQMKQHQFHQTQSTYRWYSGARRSRSAQSEHFMM